MNTTARFRFCLTMLLAALLPGCTVLAPVKDDSIIAVISKPPQELQHAAKHQATLLLMPMDSNPVYDTIRMAYSSKPYQVGYFSRHQWGAPPGQMLVPLLAAALESSGYFQMVATPPYAGHYDYALKTELQELVQDFSTDTATARLVVHVQLLDGATNRLIAGKTFSVAVPMQQKSPDAGIAASNDAAAQAMQQITAFTLDSLK